MFGDAVVPSVEKNEGGGRDRGTAMELVVPQPHDEDGGDESDGSCRDMEELLPAHYKDIVHDLRQRRKQRLRQCVQGADSKCF
jgi:hypothetical protein